MDSSTRVHKQGYKDSNLEMTESESVALPFGDSPLFFSEYYYNISFFKKQVLFYNFSYFFTSQSSSDGQALQLWATYPFSMVITH